MAIYSFPELKGKIKVGDRVRGCGKPSPCSKLNNDGSNECEITAVYDDKFDINGCWHSFANDSAWLELLTENNKTIMEKITTMFKLLTDSDTQTLKKAGYINGDLELTDEGNKELLAVMFQTNKVALVKVAQEKIDSAKE